MFYTNPLLEKTYNVVQYELCFKKYLIAYGRSGINGWARVNASERLLRTILFYSGHLQHELERPDMLERKYMNSDKAQRKEPELKTYWSGTVSGGTNIQSKQACVLRNKS